VKNNRIYLIAISILIGVFSGRQATAQWFQQTSGVSDNLYAVHFVTSELGFTVGWGSSSGAQALRTLNGGETWTHTTLSYGSFVFSVTFTDELHGYVAGCLNGGAAGAVFKTSDGGDSWTYSSMNSTYGLYAVDFPTPELGFACGWLGKIYKTTNGGASWSSVSSGTSNVLRWMSFPSATTGYIVGGSNWDNPRYLYKSSDGGNSWSYHHSFGNSVIGGVHFFNDSCGVVSGGGGGSFIKKTCDGGASWETRYSGTGLFQFITFDAQGVGYACGNSGKVVRSVDYGDTWEELDPVSPSTTLLGISGVNDRVWTVGTYGRIFRNEFETVGEPVMPNALPSHPQLGQNFPNPFNPETIISFELPVPQAVTLTLFNNLGHPITTLASGVHPAGNHQVLFDASDLNSGAYFYRLKAGAYTMSRKMILVK